MMCRFVPPNHTMPPGVPFDCYTSVYRNFGGFHDDHIHPDQSHEVASLNPYS